VATAVHVSGDGHEFVLTEQIVTQFSAAFEPLPAQTRPGAHCVDVQSAPTPPVAGSPAAEQKVNSRPLLSTEMPHSSPAEHPDAGTGVQGPVQTSFVPSKVTHAEGLLAVPNGVQSLSAVHVAVHVPLVQAAPAMHWPADVHGSFRAVVPEVVPVPWLGMHTPKSTAPEVAWRLAHVWPDPHALALTLQIDRQASVVELVSTQMSPAAQAAVEQSPFTPTVPVPTQNENSSPVLSAPMLQASPDGHPDDGSGLHGAVQVLLDPPMLMHPDGLLAVPN
jgi:hypothetical protein